MRRYRFLIGLFVAALVVGGAVVAAFNFGEKSPLYASGKIILADELVEKAKGIRTLFIIVKDAHSPMPMPYGAARILLRSDAESSVYDFVLTKEILQVMRQGGETPQVLDLKARLDVDGVAGLDTPGDLIGEMKGVAFGTENVIIKIDRVAP